MQNITQDFRQSSIVFKKAGAPKNLYKLKTQYPTVQYFLLKLRTQECVGFFQFYLDLKLFAK